MHADTSSPLPILCRVFQEAGNVLTANGVGYKCGHEPVHSSTSSECVKLSPEKDQWYCFSCHQGGNTLKAVMSLRRLSHSEAVQYVKEHFGIDLDEADTPVFTLTSEELAEPFPTEVLPAPLRRLVEEGAMAISCPPDFIAIPLLALAGTAIGISRVVEIKRGWREGGRIFSAVIAAPGSRKSPALALAATPYQDRQRRLFKEFEEARAAHDTILAQYEINAAQWKKDACQGDATAEEKPREPGEPRLAQIFTTDATLEALADLHAANPRSVAYISDELTGWARSFNQYKSGKGSDRQHWLSFWNGAQVIVNRKNRKGPLILNNPFVSVTGCLPPDVLSELFDERGREDGFIHRLLFGYPDPLPLEWTESDIDPAIVAAAVKVFDALWALDLSENDQGDSEAQVLRFTPEAKALWVEWITKHYQEQTAEDFPVTLKGPWGKLEGYCARLALIVHVCRFVSGETQSEDIDAESMIGAAALIYYHKQHARRVYTTLRSTPEDRSAVQTLEWIQKHGKRATARDLLCSHVAGIKTASTARDMLKELVDRGYGILRQEGKREVFILNA